MDTRLTKVLMAQYKRASTLEAHPNLIVYMDERNLKDWYFLIVGLDEPFKQGEYLFKLRLNLKC